MAKGTTHEDFSRPPEHEPPSSRSFGLVFATVFASYALWPLLRGEDPRLLAIAIAALLWFVALTRPSLLDVPSALWSKLGALLARVTNPIIMSALFVLVFVPTAALFRLFGKDPLGRKRARSDSYWLVRRPPGPSPQSMAKQF